LPQRPPTYIPSEGILLGFRGAWLVTLGAPFCPGL